MKFLAEMFPGDRPLFVSVAEKYGYGEIVDLLVEKAFSKGESITDMRAVQAILLVASMRCCSNYCSVFHSLIMNSMDITPVEIEHIVSHHRFPDSLKGLQQFDEFLDHAYFRKFIYADDDFSFIPHGRFKNDVPARRDFLTILVLSDFLNMLTVAFGDEVNLDLESYFAVFATHDQIDEYVKFFSAEKTVSKDEGLPVFVICMDCKRMENQTNNEWQRIEYMIPRLPKDARFSHALCPSCRDVQLEAIGG